MAVICPGCDCPVDDPDLPGCLCALKELRSQRQAEIELWMQRVNAMEKKGQKSGVNARSTALAAMGSLNRVLTSDERRENRTDFTKRYGPKPTWRKPTSLRPKNPDSDAAVRGLPHKLPQSFK
jgi:hypothetical protein